MLGTSSDPCSTGAFSGVKHCYKGPLVDASLNTREQEEQISAPAQHSLRFLGILWDIEITQDT